jgi:ADP-heptose:LPS heptosyltransferase
MNRILLIRRDNIGDLICTTPLISILRKHYPEAEIDILVNSYNYQAVEHNPDLNHVYVYTKGKHREPGQSLLGVYWQRLKLTITLLYKQYDLAILASGTFSRQALKLAKSVKPKQILSLTPNGENIAGVTLAVPEPTGNLHEVEKTLAVLQALNITPETRPLTLHPDPHEQAVLRAQLYEQPWHQPVPTIGVHISSRKPSQRWPENHFSELIQQLYQQHQVQILLFWAPGDENNPLHPGDDQKAERILAQLHGLPILPMPTTTLRQLIAGVSLCDQFICSDGGAMHIAAGLGKPMVCFFGDSSAEQWYPWGVPHVLLQPASRNVANISVEEAVDAYQQVLRLPPPHSPADVSG